MIIKAVFGPLRSDMSNLAEQFFLFVSVSTIFKIMITKYCKEMKIK